MIRLAGPTRRALPWLLALLGLLLGGAARAQEWMISVLEGEAVVIDGLRRMNAVAGLKLGSGAIVETSAKTALLRLEASDQTTFDLAGEARAMVAPAGFAARAERTPQLYLMQGWAKATQRGTLDAPGLVAPTVEVLPFKGSFVIQVVGGPRREHHLFAETGRLDVIERRAGGGSLALQGGEFLVGESGRRGNLAARPAPGWLQSVPRVFRDPVPLRAAALRERRVEPPALPGPNYGHLAEWLSTEPALRREMPVRLAPLLRDADFRNQVQQHLNQHPEWGPALAAEANDNPRSRRK